MIAKLEPANRARLQARLGSERIRANDRAGAEKFLAAAIASLGEIPRPKNSSLPSAKKLASFEFHDPAQARLNSLALAEIARLEGALDKRADAQKHLELAIAVLRASAPNKIAAKQMVEEAGHLEIHRVRGARSNQGPQRGNRLGEAAESGTGPGRPGESPANEQGPRGGRRIAIRFADANPHKRAGLG